MYVKRRIFGLCVIALVACDFGTQRNIVFSSDVASVSAVATDTNAEFMFIGNGLGQVVQADPATGAIQGTAGTWAGLNSRVVAMTSDAENNSRVWALHADGFVVNWAEGPVLTAWFWPPPAAGGPRTFCDLDHASDGDFYLTTLEDDEAVLWRRDGSTNVWSSTTLGEDTCPRVTHDQLNDELYVLRHGFMFEHRDEDSLAFEVDFVLDADGGQIADIDVLGSTVAAAGSTGSPNLPPPNGPQPGFNMGWIYDLATGNVDDAVIIGGAAPSSVHITVNQTAGEPELLIGSLAGTTTVRGRQLLP
ncbi:MAG: hypothetical protein K0V04_35680 [Deltaproteobacteria bacterium]|nr:hypothetical protein [Deltaproteobacteria bacterium]